MYAAHRYSNFTRCAGAASYISGVVRSEKSFPPHTSNEDHLFFVSLSNIILQTMKSVSAIIVLNFVYEYC